jgi:hypothetical protein
MKCSALKMEAVFHFEALVSTCKLTRRYGNKVLRCYGCGEERTASIFHLEGGSSFFSEMLLTIHKRTHYHNPQGHSLYYGRHFRIRVHINIRAYIQTRAQIYSCIHKEHSLRTDVSATLQLGEFCLASYIDPPHRNLKGSPRNNALDVVNTIYNDGRCFIFVPPTACSIFKLWPWNAVSIPHNAVQDTSACFFRTCVYFTLPSH